jgi:serine/threonine protein kinase
MPILLQPRRVFDAAILPVSLLWKHLAATMLPGTPWPGDHAIMPGFVHFMRCIGRAVVNNGGKALANLIPFGEAAYEIVKDAYEDYRRDCSEAQLRVEMEQLAQAPQAEVRQAAEQIAAEQPPETRQAVAAYLAEVPASIRQRLRRPADPSGTTMPAGMSLKKPEDLLPFLPTALPRFKPGDRPLAADWELVELLGKGGFGEVWKARHLTRSRQKPVALKFCLDPVAAATLRNEAALHDHLDRVREEASAPGIVPLLETYLRNDPPCLMYEYIEGGDLAGFVQEATAQNRLTWELATRIVHRLASIMALAHRLNPPLVHRDLKLSNALVRPGQGDLPELFVADLGIGGLAAGQALREQSSRRTLSNQMLPTAIRGAYTPLYASPQQAQGEKPDPRDDVHALGVLWYQLVSGDLKMLAIPPDWRDVVEERGLGEEQIRLLASCIASRAEKRPASVGELAERLAHFCARSDTGEKPVRPQDVVSLSPEKKEADNLRRLRDSGWLQSWVESRRGKWDHEGWLGLLRDLERSTYWPLRPEAIGEMLEGLKVQARRRWGPVHIPLHGRWDSYPAETKGMNHKTTRTLPATVEIESGYNYDLLIDYRYKGDLACLQELSELIGLRWVSMPNGITDAGLVHLAGFSLDHLTLVGCSITPAGWAHLANLSRLCSLDLTGADITGFGMDQLDRLGGLHLALEQSAVTDAGLASVASLPCLQSLYLKWTGITDAGLAHFRGHPGLKHLVLVDTAITDTGVSYLRGLKNLVELYLTRTQVTDNGLDYLAGLDGLVCLYLDGTRITDRGLAHLRHLKGLKRLGLGGTKVTARGIEGLRTALPHCQIAS